MSATRHGINGSPPRRNVFDVMTRRVHVAGPLASFKQLVRLIAENRVSAIPIVDQRGVPIGIVSESDLLLEEKHTGGPKDAVASKFMTSPVITVAADASRNQAATLMRERNVRRLVVVDARGCIAGIVSRSDLLGLLS
jgi:predicted transcriptional regulator